MPAWLMHLLLLGSLCSRVFGAPLRSTHSTSNEETETDPELAAGYFEGDLDVEFGRNGLPKETQRWPNGSVPYKIDEAFDAAQAAHIELAMKLIELSSCIRFVRADEPQKNYVFVTTREKGCTSPVGYGPGRRLLQLTPHQPDEGCLRLGVLQHELLHTLGFHHQHNSPDRDDYVMIEEENIVAGHENAFRKRDDMLLDNYDQPYDYGSILHYGPFTLSKNGKPTIVALEPDKASLMGQRLRLSDTDINRLNTMYKCPNQQ
ncbi:seminal metalloprotease 1-like [Drosophila pseudoobscura]|uniref:Metalloendopeptidase n=1 Tax=Drosophila pseudoobscura pseudoobscura TaxID=46245 RepID=A0A6I8VYS8_DROPS|nr:seminal metalloprotease 1 [Drosophila pseudoobscura]